MWLPLSLTCVLLRFSLVRFSHWFRTPLRRKVSSILERVKGKKAFINIYLLYVYMFKQIRSSILYIWKQNLCCQMFFTNREIIPLAFSFQIVNWLLHTPNIGSIDRTQRFIYFNNILLAAQFTYTSIFFSIMVR